MSSWCRSRQSCLCDALLSCLNQAQRLLSRPMDMGCSHRPKAAQPALFLLSLLFLAVSAPAAGQGLFPPVSIGDNFARGQPTVATSTCEEGEFCGPSAPPAAGVCDLETCNSTCPHRPPPEEAVELLDGSAVLEAGAVSVCSRAGCSVYTAGVWWHDS